MTGPPETAWADLNTFRQELQDIRHGLDAQTRGIGELTVQVKETNGQVKDLKAWRAHHQEWTETWIKSLPAEMKLVLTDLLQQNETVSKAQKWDRMQSRGQLFFMASLKTAIPLVIGIVLKGYFG